MDYTIHDLPESERPREKLRSEGVKSLSDSELIAILLRTGIKGKNVKELSYEILEEFELQDFPSRDIEEFKELEGISDVKAGQLKAIGELGVRLQRDERDKIQNLSDVRSKVEDLKFRSTEVLRIFYLNSGNEIVSEKEIEGAVSSVSSEPRQVFAEGLKREASALILCHNHPSGKSKFTEADLDFTREMIEAAETLGLEILDHVLVGKSVVSMREESELW